MTQPPPNYGDQNPDPNAQYGQPSLPPYLSQPTKKRKKWPWIVGAVVILFLIVGLAAGNTGDKSKNTAAPASSSAPSSTSAVPTTTDPPVQTTTEAVETTTETATEAPAPAPPPAPEERFSSAQRNAASKAGDYLDYTSFSRSGLIKQLEFDGFDVDDATVAVDSLDVDWMEQAEKKAKEYLDYTSFSQQGLVDQLVFDGFTQAQAEHGAASQY